MTELAKSYTPEYCTALLGLHAFTGCHSTGGFKGIGKVNPIKILQKFTAYNQPLSKLGQDWPVTAEIITEMNMFTCALYGKGRINDVDTVRYAKINDLCPSDNVLP